MTLTALETVKWIAEILASPFAAFDGYDDLQPRQKEAAVLAAKGASINRIADELGVRPSTAGSMVKRVTKLTGMAKWDMAYYLISEIEKTIADCPECAT